MATKRHFIYNLVGSIIPLLVNLLTIPPYLKLIGEERFGVLSVVWLVLGYFSLFNFGMGNALVSEIASADKVGRDKGELYFTAIFLNMAFSIIAVIVFYAAYYAFGIPVRAAVAVMNELNCSVIWLSLILPLAIIGSVFSGVLQVYEQFLVSNSINVMTTVLSMMIPMMVAYYYSNSLAIIVPIIFVIRLYSTMVMFVIANRLIKPKRMRFSSSDAKKLLGMGGWLTLTSIISPIMVITDRIIISYLQGAKFVTFYSIPYQLTEKINLLASSVTNTIYTKLARFELEEAKQIAAKSICILLAMNTPLVILGIFALKPFLAVWISPEFSSNAHGVAKLLLISFWINGLTLIPHTYLLATGQPKINAKIYMVEIIPYLVLLYFCLKYWDIKGAAIAACIRFLTDFTLMSHYSGLFKDFMRICFIPIILVMVSYWGSYLSDTKLQVFVLCCCEAVVVFRFYHLYAENVQLLRKKFLK